MIGRGKRFGHSVYQVLGCAAWPRARAHGIEKWNMEFGQKIWMDESRSVLELNLRLRNLGSERRSCWLAF